MKTDLPSPPPDKGTDTLNAVLTVLAPLVKLMLSQGATYPQMLGGLKALFLDAGKALLEQADLKVNDSSLSALTGVHRKDVRLWRTAGAHELAAPSLTLASALFTAWKTLPGYADENGTPQAIARSGIEPSFEALAQHVTRDVHPATVLQELVRLELVEVDGVDGVDEAGTGAAARVRPRSDVFLPRGDDRQMLNLLRDNLADHASTAVGNLLAPDDPRLEQSVFVHGITADGARELGLLARKLWAQSFQQIAAEANRVYARDRAADHADYRVRFGSYFFAGPLPSTDEASDHD